MKRCSYCGCREWEKKTTDPKRSNAPHVFWACKKCGCSIVKDPSISEIASELNDKIMKGRFL